MKKHGNGIRTIALVLFFCMVTIMAADATIWYVRTNGNDANTGDSVAQALATIRRVAFKNPADGDIIDVGPGTYSPTTTESVILSRNMTIRGSDPNDRPVYENIELTLQSTTGFTIQDMILDGTLTVENIVTIKTGANNYSLVNTDIINPAYTAPGVQHGCLLVEDCQGLSITNCSLLADHTSALAPSLLQNIGFLDGFGIASSNVVISGCTFSVDPIPGGSSGGNIRIEHGMTNFTLENSTFLMSPREWIIIAAGVQTTPVHGFINMTIRNNTFVKTTRVTGMYFDNPNYFENFIFEGNNVSNSQDAALWFAGNLSGTDRQGSTIDGLSISNNTFHDIGVGTSLQTDAVIVLDDCLINATNGRTSKINNNTITDSRGGSQGGWTIEVRSSGQNLTIADNFIQDRRECCVLIDTALDDAILPMTGMQNLIIKNNTCDYNNYGGIVLQDRAKDGVTIENNIIMDCLQYGVSLESQENLNVSIKYNDVWRCGACIQTAAPGTVISNNEVYDSLNASRAGIWLRQMGTSDVSNCVISFNMVTGCQGYGIMAATTVPGIGLNVYNNTIAKNIGSGMFIGRDDLNFYNNIVAFHEYPGTVGVEYAATTMGDIGYNLVYTYGGVRFAGFAVPDPVFPGDLQSNPEFTDIFTPNFTLRPTSPALKAGAVLQGGTFIPNSSDLGAYPSSGASGSDVAASAWELYR